MLPFRDVIPTRTTPWITIAAVAAIVVTAATGFATHAGWLAVLANVVALGSFGETLEDRLGHGRFTILLVAGAAAAVAASGWIAPDVPWTLAVATGGAATALGGYLALFRRSRVLVLVPGVDAVELPALIVLALWAVLHAVALDPMEAFYFGRALVAAELSGLAVGALVVWPLRRRERMQPAWWDSMG